jgi:hypothetical protein
MNASEKIKNIGVSKTKINRVMGEVQKLCNYNIE